jgi:hypothetical protein
MQVTITNATSADFYVSLANSNIAAGESITLTGRSTGDIDAEDQLKKDILAGSLTVVYALEAVDAVVTGQGSPLPAFANEAALPAPAAYPLFSPVWQTDNATVVWTDGTNWKLATGITTA